MGRFILKDRRHVQISLLYIIVTVIAIFFLLPLAYSVSSSLKLLKDVFSFPMQWIPSEVHLENFIEPFIKGNFTRYFLNSIFIAVVVTLSSVFFCSLAGYSLTKFRYPGREAVFILILSTAFLPVQVTLIPLYILVRKLGWLNTYRGLIIPVSLSTFATFLMRQFFSTIPNEYIDAAKIDGCSEFGIFFRIVLPMSKPALAALIIYVFVGSWGSFIYPFVIVSKDNLRPMPVGLLMFFEEFVIVYNQLIAMALLSILPVIIMLLFSQKLLIRAMVMSGLKQ